MLLGSYIIDGTLFRDVRRALPFRTQQPVCAVKVSTFKHVQHRKLSGVRFPSEPPTFPIKSGRR